MLVVFFLVSRVFHSQLSKILVRMHYFLHPLGMPFKYALDPHG